MNQFPHSPRVSPEDRFKFFRKFVEIFTGQGAPPDTGIKDTTGGKFATGVNNSLICEYLREFSKKFETALMGVGETD
jgi:hypothetical protein